MKKWTLYGEFCGKSVYGESLGDALLHSGLLPRQGGWDIEAQKVIYPDMLRIKKVIALENTLNSTRGGDRFDRVIVETEDGVRMAIDGKPENEDNLVDWEGGNS